MKRVLAALLCVPALMLASPWAGAKTLRWASQGDPQTADPHSQNESLTNLFSASVHDTLVMRDNTLKLVPGLATSWQQVNPTTTEGRRERQLLPYETLAATCYEAVPGVPNTYRALGSADVRRACISSVLRTTPSSPNQ